MFSEFETIDKQQWLKKITKELAGRKTLDSLKQELDGSVISDPLLLHEDQVINEDIFSFPSRCHNGLYIDKEIHSDDLLEYLQLGISGLYIENLSDESVNELLKEVELSYLFTIIQSSGECHNKLINNGSVKSTLTICDPIQQFSITDSLQAGSLVKDLKAHITTATTTGILGIELNDHFLTQIAIFRASRILLQNKCDGNFKIVGFTSPTQDSDEANLIALTNQALAAKIGGLDMILMSRTSHDDAVSIKRHLHICNILDMESEMDQLNDPIKGSYYLEHLTKQLVDILR